MEEKRLAVHPHMRGEYCSVPILRVSPVGSPPHAWGIRLIRTWGICGGSVHPHMRGEYSLYPASKCWRTGSPPHAWGIPIGHAQATYPVRFTPTCVGNTTP